MTNLKNNLLDLSRVQLSEKGKASYIIPEGDQTKEHGLLVCTTEQGYKLVISDGQETVHRYHPEFWEAEDPKYIRKFIPPHDPKIREMAKKMPPGCIVEMTDACKNKSNISLKTKVRGTLISWKSPYQTNIIFIKVIIDGYKTPKLFQSTDWNIGSQNPEELEIAFLKSCAA